MPLNVIAIEEHFWTPELQGLRPAGLIRDPEHAKRLDDIGALRIAEMDAAGIDMQVLSETAPAVHELDPDKAIPLAKRSNDYLHGEISKNPTRFAGFAALPVSDPKAAADELERAVTKLGFKGAMFMGLCKGRFLDEKFFWPIFERAEKLDVPVYLHPSKPHQAVIDAYFKDHPSLIGPSLGFGNEVLTMAARLVVGGVLDAYPKLKVIIGHLGEGLPFLQWRMDRSLARDAKLPQELHRLCEAALLDHHQRRLLRQRAAVLDCRARHRQGDLLGRLPLCEERARAEVARRAADHRAAAGADRVREREEAAQALI